MDHQQGRLSSMGFALLLFAAGMTTRLVADDPKIPSIEDERLDTMQTHSGAIEFRSKVPDFPKRLVRHPLFRYDDLARGYVDGAVWRLGSTGRPKAIITTELHPRYDGAPRIVYDFLSLTSTPFVAVVNKNTTWSPTDTAVEMTSLRDGPKLAATQTQRLFQLKKMSERFTGHQTVEGQELELRLLPRPIDRYQPSEREESDAAIFLFVSGRNPGILLVLESEADHWKFGVGRLSGPSHLKLELDGEVVWSVAPSNYGSNGSYTAANFPISVPGY